MNSLVLDLKSLFKTAKSLGVSLSSIHVIVSLVFGQRFRAIDIAKVELRRNPCNWSWYLFLLEHYRSHSDRQASVELLERFSSSCLPSLFCEHLPFSNELQKISFTSIVEAFFLSSCDKRDFCEFDFLGGSCVPSFSLHIVFVGRFSNFLVQLANAIAIAIAFNIKNIYVTPCQTLLNIFPALHTIPCSLSDISIHFCTPKDGFVIRGFFFHVGRQWNNFLYANHPFRNIVSLFRHATHFPQTIPDHCQRRSQAFNKNLVIHLRSGDIFGSKIVHPEYGQPPLSYYIYAIEHFAPLSVTLVYEDTLNPVINALQNYLRCSNIPYDVQCSDLRSDLNVLSNSSALVMSRGTFAYGILCFNDVLSTIYCFSSSLEADPMMSLHLSRLFYGEHSSACRPKILEVTDKVGYYFNSICSANWLNSSSQKELMISYPSENLSLNFCN